MRQNTSSRLLNGIYDLIKNDVWVAGSNEDVYTKEAVKKIVHFCAHTKLVTEFLWEDHRNNAENGSILAISWIEDGKLYQQLFVYADVVKVNEEVFVAY